jgi:hypothetical protein
MSNQTSEIEDQDLWPDARLAQAELEIAAEIKRRADAAAAQQQATQTLEEREAIAMKQFGKQDPIEARKQILKEFGFDPGWR